MSSTRFANQLRETADCIDDASPTDLQILLRRAALRLDNTLGIVFEAEIEDVLCTIGSELKLARSALIQRIVREWLEGNVYREPPDPIV